MPVTTLADAAEATRISLRQTAILEVVRTRGFATMEQLAEICGVSTQTIRRDVMRLDEGGLLQRFHGGAGLPDGQAAEEAPDEHVRLGYRDKQASASGPKARIGQRAAALVPEGATIYLDVGTTAEAVARSLRHRRLRAVYTNSLSAAAHLAEARDMEVYVTGGMLRGAGGALVGDSATRLLADLAVDLAVIGCSGFGEDGSPMDFDPQKVSAKQAVLAQARAAVLVTDSTKFDRQALARIAPPTRFTALVTDAEPPPPLAQRLRQAGVTTLLA